MNILNNRLCEQHVRTRDIRPPDCNAQRKKRLKVLLTLAGLPVASKDESGSTTAVSGFVAPAEEADVRASSRLTVGVNLTRVALD